ncbi:MAG: hypothetical protein M3279_09645 [Actinomycetota bacterium]|nr:hypothetical protein [Actinomycetota bacterium]
MTRPPCSPQERDAAETVAARLRQAGYLVEVEEFAARASTEVWFASYAGLSALAALLVYPLPLVAAIVGVAAIVLYARDSDGRPVWRRPSCTGRNVVARPPAAEGPSLVVVAPLVSRPPRFGERAARALVVPLQTLMVAIPAAGAAAWIAEVEAELPGFVPPAGAAVAVAVAVLGLTLHRPAPPVAPETNAPLEVLLGLARGSTGRPVWFVATGAPDAGTAGIEALLRAREKEVAGAVWLNLAASPSGVVAVSEEGAWRERRADRRLMGAAEEAGAEVRPYRAAPTSATPLLARRRRALTLMVADDAEGERIAESVAAGVLGLAAGGTLEADAGE